MTEIDRDALVRDLAMVLRGALHPDAKIGPSPRLAVRRLREALGIDGYARIEYVTAALDNALFPAEPAEAGPAGEDDLDRALHAAAQQDGQAAEAESRELFGG